MNSLLIVFILGVSSAYCSILPAGVALVGPGTLGATLKGPSSEGTVIGPDGSIVSGAADAGALVAGALPGGAISAAVAPGVVGLASPIGWGAGLGWGGIGARDIIAPAISKTLISSPVLVGGAWNGAGWGWSGKAW